MRLVPARLNARSAFRKEPQAVSIPLATANGLVFNSSRSDDGTVRDRARARVNALSLLAPPDDERDWDSGCDKPGDVCVVGDGGRWEGDFEYLTTETSVFVCSWILRIFCVNVVQQDRTVDEYLVRVRNLHSSDTL